MTSILLIFAIISIIYIYIYYKPKEHFEEVATKLETVATKPTEEEIVELEGMKCKYLYGNKQYDIMRNWRMIDKGGDEPLKCYLKMSDVLVGNECHKGNERLYKDNYKNIVADIKVEKIKDPMVSKTVFSDACVLDFKDSATHQDKKDYTNFIDRNDPRFKILDDERLVLEDVLKKTNEEIEKKNAEIEAIRKSIGEKEVDNRLLEEAISSEKGVYDIKNRETEETNRIVDMQKSKMKNLHGYYKDVSEKTVRICKDFDLEGKCHYLPIGDYPWWKVERLYDLKNEASSIHVPEGLKATVYSGHDMAETDNKSVFVGPTQVNSFWRPWDKGGGDMNDQVRSIRIEKVMINPEPTQKQYLNDGLNAAQPIVGRVIDVDECCNQNHCKPCNPGYADKGFREHHRGYCFPRANQPVWTRQCEYTGKY